MIHLIKHITLNTSSEWFFFEAVVLVIVDRKNIDRNKHKRTMHENLYEAAKRLGQRFIFQQDNNLKHTAGATEQWFLSNGIHVLENKPVILE